MPEKKTKSYDQKYLDEKFAVLTDEFKSLSLAINTHIAEQRVVTDKIYNKISDLEKTDVHMEADLRTIKKELRETAQQALSNNFYSVKGIAFVVAIFALLMFAFLLNGTELLKNSI
jgi:hypothetical protein